MTRQRYQVWAVHPESDTEWAVADFSDRTVAEKYREGQEEREKDPFVRYEVREARVPPPPERYY